MTPICSCGATLPDDARFCHRCGKPQREETREARSEFVAPHSITLSRPQPPEGITFSNPLALRTSVLVAIVSTVVELVPFTGILAPLLGGFVSAFLYQRRSGHAITSGAGAKLGWITAILNALMITAFVSVRLAVSGNAMVDMLREGLRQQAASPSQQQALQMMSDSRFLALVVLIIWIVLFAFGSALFMAGGALGARIYRTKAS